MKRLPYICPELPFFRMSYKLPLEMFYHWEQHQPDKIFLRQPVHGQWKTWTWSEAGREIRQVAAWLSDQQLPSQSHIALLSKNCAHWIMCDLAIMMAGHVSVPLYPNLAAGSIRQILEHSEAPLLFVGKLDNWASMKPGVPAGVRCVGFPAEYGDTGYMNWSEIIRTQAPMSGTVERHPDDLMTIIYTSGSTGLPKGVMHAFGPVAFAITEAVQFVQLASEERFFSYLPMAHVGERFLVEMGVLYTGGEVYFAESIDTFQANLQEAAPTIMLGVHRIWKKFQDGILGRMPQKKLDRMLSIPLVNSLIKKAIRKKLGLHKARIMFTAASPTPPELLEWFERLGIHIVEAYSMTENFAYSHSNLPGKNRIGWVGIPLPHNEVRLGHDGEVQCRSKAIMLGYYKDPELTKATITEDGFLCTGDEGVMDADGYLRITGRTKDIFKTSKGKYVVPSPIEMQLSACSDLEFSCITGANLPQPIALVTLSEGGRQKSAAALVSTLERLMDALNQELDSHQRIAKVVVVPDQWLPDNDMLTPTFKLKRREIEGKYGPLYHTWNEMAEKVIFARA